MRIHILLMSGLLVSGLSFVVHATGISGGPGPVSYAPNNTARVMDQIQSQLGTVEGALNALQQALQALAEEQANKPQEPGPSGMSKEEADEKRAQHEKALAAWQNKIKGLLNKVKDAQVKLAAAERKLQKMLSSDLPAAQHKDQQTRRRAMQRARTVRGAPIGPAPRTRNAQGRRAARLRGDARKLLANSRKRRQQAALLHGRIKRLLQKR